MEDLAEIIDDVRKMRGRLWQPLTRVGEDLAWSDISPDHRPIKVATSGTLCERCGDDRPAWHSARTMDHALCRECAEEHHKNWDDQWAEYYSGLL